MRQKPPPAPPPPPPEPPPPNPPLDPPDPEEDVDGEFPIVASAAVMAPKSGSEDDEKMLDGPPPGPAGPLPAPLPTNQTGK